MWFFLVFSITLGAVGQILMKEAMKGMGPVPLHDGARALALYFFHTALSPYMAGAVLSYGVSGFIWLGILSMADLTLIRPLMSMGYLITMIYGYYAGENLTPGRVVGTLLIIAGLVFVARSSDT